MTMISGNCASSLNKHFTTKCSNCSLSENKPASCSIAAMNLFSSCLTVSKMSTLEFVIIVVNSWDGMNGRVNRSDDCLFNRGHICFITFININFEILVNWVNIDKGGVRRRHITLLLTIMLYKGVARFTKRTTSYISTIRAAFTSAFRTISGIAGKNL